jgi:hypothetical protein
MCIACGSLFNSVEVIVDLKKLLQCTLPECVTKTRTPFNLAEILQKACGIRRC